MLVDTDKLVKLLDCVLLAHKRHLFETQSAQNVGEISIEDLAVMRYGD